MFDARKLLDQVVGSLGSATADLQRPGESLTDAARRNIDQGLASSGLAGQGGGLAAGAIAGGVLGLLLGSKTGRKLGGTAVKAGGLALIASLAYKAWTARQQQAGAPAGSPGELLAPPSDSPFHPEAPGTGDARAREILVAMIAAAKADGHIDADEQRRIFDRLDDLALDAEAKAFVMDELRAPVDIDRVVAMATSPAAATEIYAASLLAMNPDTPEERAYLDRLASRLGIDKALAAEIEHAAATATG